MDTPQDNLLIDFEEPKYQFVGFWPRFGALFIDGIILGVFALIFSFIFNDVNSLTFILTTSLIPIIYNPVLEYYYGATIGKMAIRIKIINYNLRKLTLNNVILRNIIYFTLQLISLAGDLNQYFNRDGITNLFSLFTNFEDWFTTVAIFTVVYLILFIVVYIVEIIFLVSDEKHRSLHDRIGKTYVVYNTK